jgi:branched-subunit amino acid transport protein AzlD
MIDVNHSLQIIIVATLATVLTRAIPFLLFGGGRKIPQTVTYLGGILPHAVMAALLVYCLKGISFALPGMWLHEILAVLLTATIHRWKRNTLLSIALGTVAYMLLSQGLLGF